MHRVSWRSDLGSPLSRETRDDTVGVHSAQCLRGSWAYTNPGVSLRGIDNEFTPFGA